MTHEPPAGPADDWARHGRQLTELLAALTEAGIDPDGRDVQVVDLLAGWEPATVATVASWIKRANR
jgi:hypothetical protein